MKTGAGASNESHAGKPVRNAAANGQILRAYALGLCTSAALFFLVSCGPRFTNDNIDVVNREFAEGENIGRGGVSAKEVESILGPPNRVEPYVLRLEKQKNEHPGLRYYYVQDGEELELHFLDNKLISRVPKLGLPAREGEKKEN